MLHELMWLCNWRNLWLCDLWLLHISQYSVKFGGQRPHGNNFALLCDPCDHVVNMISDIVDNSNSSEASVLSNLLVKFVNLTTWAKCRKWFVAIYYELPLLKFDYYKACGGEDILFLFVTWPHLTLRLKS